MLISDLYFPFLVFNWESFEGIFPSSYHHFVQYNLFIYSFILFFQVTDQMEVIFDEEGFYLDSSVTLKSDLVEFPYEEVFNAVSIKLRRLYILLAVFLISIYGAPLAR